MRFLLTPRISGKNLPGPNSCGCLTSTLSLVNVVIVAVDFFDKNSYRLFFLRGM